MMSESPRRSSSTGLSKSNSQTDVISPVSCLSVRPIRVSDSHFHSSGRVSSLASRVNVMSLMETRGPCQPLSATVSPPGLLSMEDLLLPKSFNDVCPSPTPSMDFETPWYRYCRPTAPVPSVSDCVEVATTPIAAAAAGDLLEDHLDQGNFSPRYHPTASPPFVLPLTTVSNILFSPIKFGERLPKWSVLHRSKSSHLPQYPSSSSLPELLTWAPFRSTDDEELNAYIVPPRDSPQTSPIPVFDRRRSRFTSRAAPGIARPTVLNRGPTLSFDTVATRIIDFRPLKRSATNDRSTSEELSVKKIRVHSLVPSERSAFLPVVHRGRSMVNSLDSSSASNGSTYALPSLLPSSSI
ncbi:conserved hypothetical protein [Echinococcus multilocularis]|uniref:Uncharacterized protein n=1 Tax=Echinococcus multilocularis TaxID=6211 RepID=A0A068Y854_ECHMU|nr:conserved hypothetical protein [Echinococcus multilocularis]